MRRKGFIALCLSFAGTALVRPVSAQAPAANFPTKPITLLVGDAPGGPIDATARVVGPALAKVLGQRVIVENRPDAAGLKAQTATAKARADGYTLVLAGTTDLVVAPRLGSPPYTVEEFAGLGLVSETPLVIEVPATSRFQSFAEMAAHAKAHPDTARIGHAGNGTTGQPRSIFLSLRMQP